MHDSQCCIARYYTEVSARDVEVILNNHVHLEDINIQDLPELMPLGGGTHPVPEAAPPSTPAIGALRRCIGFDHDTIIF